MANRDPTEDQAAAVVGVLVAAVPAGTVVAAYLYGSAVTGGLHRDSDLDLLGVVSRRLTDAEKRAVVGGLIPISRRDLRPMAWRPVELTLLVLVEVRPWHYPPRFDLQYGEWLRDDLADGSLPPSPDTSPDVALLVTMVRLASRTLFGVPAADLLDPVPHADVVRAISDEVVPMLEELESDTRNVLLTLARMWTTVVTGGIRSKGTAADWALCRLPRMHRPVLELAAAAYRGEAEDAEYDAPAVKALAEHVVTEIGRADSRLESGATGAS
ncbi:MAG: aminoglycoside adenylyltransferase family protein [Candidatus Limnocylindria bacterium]